MFALSDFFNYCENADVDVFSYSGMPTASATIRDGTQYCIALDFSKICTMRSIKGVCLHEYGHCASGALHKLSSPYEIVGRSEYKAVKYASETFLTESDFKSAFLNGYVELWQLAEWFDLPEEDVEKSLHYWTECRNVNFGGNEETI